MSTTGKGPLRVLGSPLAANVVLMVLVLALAVTGPGFALPSWVGIPLLVVGMLLPVVWFGIAARSTESMFSPARQIVSALLSLGTLAALAAGGVAYTAAESLMLEQRGRWTEAVVVEYQPGRVVPGRPPTELDPACVLETAEGERIRPNLDESRGCSGLGTGSRVEVIHDPLGRVKPRTDEPPSYTAVTAWLAVAAVVTGTAAGTVLGPTDLRRLRLRRRRRPRTSGMGR